MPHGMAHASIGMAASYRPYEPDQVMLLPAPPQDWLPTGHLAHFINDTVDALELKAFYARYEGGGSRNQPFHPAMMVKVQVCEVVVALGGEGKVHPQIDAQQYPHTAAMATKLKTEPGQAAYRKRKWIAGRRTDGSRTNWAYGSSACEACTGCAPSGSSCVWR
jgi:hypothetical protein